MFTVRKDWKVDQTIILGLFSDNFTEVFEEISDLNGFNLKPYIESGSISTGPRQVERLLLSSDGEFRRVYFFGLGSSEDLTRDEYKRIMGYAFQTLQKDGVQNPALVLDSFIPKGWDVQETASLIGEVMLTSTYVLPSFKTGAQKEKEEQRLTVLTSEEPETIQTALEKGSAYADGVNTGRYLVHLPANVLTPSELAEFARTMAEDYDFTYKVLEKQDMEELGMGALLAVNQGSVEPPKMIVMKYQGLEDWSDVTALVGKGITYDTGGYSIKTKTGMPGMKGDMGGAAAVLGAMETIGQLKPKKNVIAVIPSSDNMISGEAFKPDDVITSMSGKTIEVLNTDAEGRLALADGVTYAQKEGADRVIDVATLTGGVVTALGSWMTGAMTNDQAFYHAVEQSGQTVGEPIWLLPYNEDYKAQVRKSDIADLNNSPTRKAHAIMGGAFVGAFVENVPWVHLDIAGTSTSEGAYELGPKGPTGVMAKTLAHYVIQ
ncbi:leucyl aminopeptidase [Halobacillus litoralis]|uniref:leucyl aminopeptidase n=1 Tax=Halobacillus litoralis TaxID=45668 RepID=UPI001CFECD87|nr:leucyl aminopeptidase [Halobacillus litoralis]